MITEIEKKKLLKEKLKQIKKQIDIIDRAYCRILNCTLTLGCDIEHAQEQIQDLLNTL